MNKEEIKNFLRNKKGYLKEGAGRLSKKLNCDFNDCACALREVRKEVRNTKKIIKNKNIKRLFYDIETSYNIGKFWRAGYNLNINPGDIIHERAIICISYKWQGENKVHTLKWNKGCDKKLVTDFVKIIEEADELVGHNIDRYDTKFLMTRAAIHNIPALPKYASFDTLKKAKKHFMFNSNKLDYLGKVLGLGGKLSHNGMPMWDDIVLKAILNLGSNKRYKKSLKKMIKYCEKDVVLTEEVFHKLRSYSEHNVHHGKLNTGSNLVCPECGSSDLKLVKRYVTKAGTIKMLMECKDCNSQFFMSHTNYLKLNLK